MLRLIAIIFTLSTSLSLVHAVELAESLKYLSSDKLKGRRAGAPENNLAAEYLKNNLAKFGVRPLGSKYLQDFTIFTKMAKVGENSLKYANKNVSFEPLSFSQSGTVKNTSIVFAGFGITIPNNDPNIQYDDYANIDVKGKLVVVLTGDPGVGNTNSPFRNPAYMNYQTLIYKLKNASQHGAKAVLVIQDPLSLSDPNKEPDLYFNSTEGGGMKFAVLSGFTTNKWFNILLNKSGTNTLELQRKIAKKQSPASFEVVNESVSVSVNLKKQTGRVSNVIGIIPGTDEQLKNEIIVLGAHFDHLGMGGQSSMESDKSPKIHNGADDNASGTASVLELARSLTKKPMKRSIMIAFFNAEEEGLLGSQHLVSSWPRYESQYGTIKAMLNFDMIGRFNKELSLMGVGSAFEWKDVLEELEGMRDLPIAMNNKAVGNSDHSSFTQEKIPALFFTTGAHEDYHRSTDDFEKIDLVAMSKMQRYFYSLVSHLASNPVKLTFDPSFQSDNGSGRDRGYGAHLGCVPKFGQSEDIVGVLCTQTVPGSPAESAGLIANDVIIAIGEIDIKNIYDLSFALKFYRSGDSVLLKWKRGAQLFSRQIKLSSKNVKALMLHQSCHHPSIQ